MADAVSHPTFIAQRTQEVVLMPGIPLPNLRHAPAGVGFARKRPLFMKDHEVCEIKVEGIGLPRKSIIDERAP